jgi:hypothetical protein
MTVSFNKFDTKSSPLRYDKCGSPAKYRVPNPKMAVEYVCGIHANSLNKMFERIGSDLKCIPIGKLL